MVGRVFHQRHATAGAPQQHGLSYRHWCGLFTISDVITLPLIFFLKWIFQFAPSDYGAMKDKMQDKTQDKIRGGTLHGRIKKIINQETTFAAKKLELITQGRVLFYIFNPVSFWLAYDDKNILRVILAEVHNTYGEHHYYVLCKKNLLPIDDGDIFLADKEFHVSPFYDRVGYYRFQFAQDSKKFSANIKLFSPQHELQLDTGMVMKKIPMNNKNALWLLLTMPLQPWKVIFTIHLHALYLFFKRLRFRPKPQPQQTKITHGVHTMA